jgi:hypothetical protein
MQENGVMLGRLAVLGNVVVGWLRQAWPGGHPERLVERRQWLRYRSHASTRIQIVQNPDNAKQMARVDNVSLGGIRLLVDQPQPAGSLLHIEVPQSPRPDPQNLLVCVVNVFTGEPCVCALGCSFIRELTSEELQAFL